MAEFKLGRIRFVWKNSWTEGTRYYKDDVVAVGGRIYICVIGHTSDADFFNDLDIVPSKWNLVSDGQTWKGDWLPQTRYVYNDIVKYGARLYICQTVHTSAEDSTVGLEADLANWQVFADGLDWKGVWETEFDYKVNDLVKYGANNYVCITPHISAATTAEGLEVDSANWELFSQGIEYKSVWQSDFRYKFNDVVRYGAGLWICTGPHTSSVGFADDSAFWEKFVEGFQYEDEWDNNASYQTGDVVRYGGNQYLATSDNIFSPPTQFPNLWTIFSEGLRFLGDWGEDSSSMEYRVGEVVRLGGYTYRCIEDHTDQQPPNPLYWLKLNSGFDWRGEWLDDQEYFEGDVVRFGDNSYVCVQNHISEGDDESSLGGAANSRPDNPNSGAYWNILVIGTEQSVLTTTGDMVYYSGSAPTRLPIGRDGQVLTVNADGLPEWAFLGATEDVYYVAEHGRDLPAPEYGQSIDRPFRSIRYAAEQVEQGTKHPRAARLLELNRRFIQREIVEWTDYQIANATEGSIWENLEYESSKCERDMGLLVDAFIWDITHGGNVRSREAALSYVNETAGSPYLNQKEQTVASIQYGISLIQKVLAQEAPDVNYQVTNGDNSTAIVEQWFDLSLGRQDNVEYSSTISSGSVGGQDSEVGESSQVQGGGY
jgi:hypothetical protein